MSVKAFEDWGERLALRCQNHDPAKAFEPTLQPDTVQQFIINTGYAGGAGILVTVLLGGGVSSVLPGAIAGAAIYDGVVLHELYQRGLVKSFFQVATNSTEELICSAEQPVEKFVLGKLRDRDSWLRKGIDLIPSGNIRIEYPNKKST